MKVGAEVCTAPYGTAFCSRSVYGRHQCRTLLATFCSLKLVAGLGIGKALTRRLKDLIPRQQFKVSIQAAIGQKIVASSAISAMRKDVLAKCYGGDISRKKKLLNKQAKGKKRMKAMGKVNVPQEAFMAVLGLKDD